MDPQEGISMQDPIILNLEIKVTEEDGVATLECPSELRITERVASIFHQAVDARGLKLKKWVVSPEQQSDLEGLSNVAIVEVQEG